MQEPNERRFEDQQDHDAPTLPYTEPQNPYASSEEARPSDSHTDEPQNPYAETPHGPPSAEPDASQNPYAPHEAASNDPAASPSPPSGADPAYIDDDGSLPGATTSEYYGPAMIGQPLPPVAAQSSKRNNIFWFAMGALSMLVLGLILSTSAYFIATSVNRSTPMKTLDAFCDSLRVENYEAAYENLSRKFQNTLTEADFEHLLSQDRVVGCTHGNADESRSVTSTNLKLVHASQGINNDIVTLTKDTNNTWKINDLSNAAGG